MAFGEDRAPFVVGELPPLADFVRGAVAEFEIGGVDGEDAADLELQRLEIPAFVVGLAREVEEEDLAVSVIASA